MAQLTFDATQYNPEQGVGQLSVGRHLVIIEKDEIKKANGSDGGYLQFDLKGVGDSQAESGAYRLNLYNNNPKTVEIAHRQLSAVCYAVGVLGINGDTSVLHGLPFQVEVAYQKGHNPKTDGDEAKGYTEIKRVYTASGEEIKAGMQPGGNGNQNQNTGFNSQNQNNNQQQQQNQNQNNGNQQQQNNGGGNGFNNQNQNQQQQNTNFNNGNNQNNNQQQNNNGGGGNGGWQPGQGQQNNGSGTQWQPRQN